MNPELRQWLAEPLEICPNWLSSYLAGCQASGHVEGRSSAPRQAVKPGVVAVVGILGPMVQREGVLTAYYGFVSTDWVARTVRGLAEDSAVKAIVLDMNTPGGSTLGGTEAADVIYEAAKKKKIVAVANSMMASLGYKLASQATQVVASPSSLVGSIGTYTMHVDYTEAEKRFGIKTTYISAGKYKTEGFETLTPEARDRMQQMVDQMYGKFVAAVARGRGVQKETVRNGFGEGRLLTAEEALKERLVDRIGTFDDVVAGIARGAAVADANERNLRLAGA